MDGLPLLDLPSPLAIVCHDAGAANLILPWTGRNRGHVFRPVMEGPARRLWEDRYGSSCHLWHLDAALDGAKALLTGTGWQSDLEHQARRAAKQLKLPQAAVVDHWVNYQERFVRNGETVLPDEIWVVDEHAIKIARQCFPKTKIQMKPNWYLAEQVTSIAPPAAGAGVLYVMEPAHSRWGRGEPGEFQALEYFLQHRSLLAEAMNLPVRLRAHPSDPAGKYVPWLEQNRGAGVELATHATLADEISRASWVVGCQSFAMVVALAAGRQVVSTLPPWAPGCSLPYPEIIHLKDLVATD